MYSKRNIDGYTLEVTQVEDGFSVVVTMPKGNKHISHSYIKSYAWKNAHEIMDNHRRSTSRK